MRNRCGFGLPMAMVLCGLALAATGCSSTQPPGNDGGDRDAQGGAGGQSGTGGAAGMGIDAGTDAGETCGSLIQEYNSAFAAARTCNPTLNIAQCAQLASASLQCPNCAVHVTDTTRLDEIRAAFQARTDCPLVPCPAILCINPGNSGACVANDGGSSGSSGSSGSCVDVHTS